jgi:hypothetical protein
MMLHTSSPSSTKNTVRAGIRAYSLNNSLQQSGKSWRLKTFDELDDDLSERKFSPKAKSPRAFGLLFFLIL